MTAQSQQEQRGGFDLQRKAQQNARAVAARRRRKLGLDQVTLELPIKVLAEYLRHAGYLAGDVSKEPADRVVEALQRKLDNDLTPIHRLASQRDAYPLDHRRSK